MRWWPNAHVVDDKTLLLELVAHAVDAGDGLEQVVVGDHLVQVHDLLDGGVEAGKQHVVDDDDADAPVHLGLTLAFDRIEGQFEALDAAFVVAGVGVSLDVRRVVVAAGNDHGRLQAAQPIHVDPFWVALFQLVDLCRQSVVEGGLVADRCLAGDSHHLSLEAVGEDKAHVVLYHVGCFGPDGLLRLQVGVAGAEAQDLQALAQLVVAEDVGEALIHARLIHHLGVVGAPFVDDFQRRAVFHATGAWCICRCSRRRSARSCRWACRCRPRAPRWAAPGPGWRPAVCTGSGAPRPP